MAKRIRHHTPHIVFSGCIPELRSMLLDMQTAMSFTVRCKPVEGEVLVFGEAEDDHTPVWPAEAACGTESLEDLEDAQELCSMKMCLF
jgi:hypothetical protein